MSAEQTITMAYLAEMAGVNAPLVRRYAKQLREMMGDSVTQKDGACDLQNGQGD